MIASTSSSVVSIGARARRRTIARAIAAGVALLAVLAQRRGARRRSSHVVDDLARVSSCVGVHAHVERRVVGVGEAALARVDLHRGHAEVDVDEVGAARPPRRAARSAVGEVGADEARAARRPRPRARRSAPRRAGRGRSRSACPSAPSRSATRRAWPPAPNVQSTATSPGWGSSASISSPASTGTCVRVMSSRMAKAMR